MTDDGVDWASEEGIERHISESWRCYQSGACGDGERLALAAITGNPMRGDGWYVLALNLERSGQLAVADRAWQRASLAPVHPQLSPFRVGWRRFERAVARAADSLPAPLRRALEEVELVLKNYALPELVEDPDGDELLMVQLGPTRSESEGPDAGGEPPTAIVLYRRAHEHRCTSAAEFDALVQASLIEGLGQFLGLPADEVGRLIDEL